MWADDVEQAARLFGVEVGVVVDREDAFAGPDAIFGAVDRVDDVPLEGGPTQQLGDEFFRPEEIDGSRFIDPPRQRWGPP